MLVKLYELSPKKILVLGVLGFIAASMGWSVISPLFDETKEITEHCNTLAAKVVNQLNTANYCDSNENCTQAALPCPFSCNSYVNANTPLDSINQSVKRYSEACGYCVEDCIQAKPVCVNHQCVSFATL